MSESAPAVSTNATVRESWWRKYLNNPVWPLGATVAIVATFLVYRFLDNALTGLRNHTPAAVNYVFGLTFLHAPVLLLLRRQWAWAAMAILLCLGLAAVFLFLNMLIPMFATPLYYALFVSP